MSVRFIQVRGAGRPIGYYTAAAAAPEARLVFTAGQVAVDAAGQVVAVGDMAGQARQAYVNLRAVLEAGGARLESVLKTTTYVTDIAAYHRTATHVRREVFPHEPPPGTLIEVNALSRPEFLIEVEAVAVVVAEPAAG